MARFELETYFPSRLEEFRLRMKSIFVGREQELDQLRSLVNRTRESAPSFVLITGEKGIGKSTLVKEFCNLARTEGICVYNVKFHRGSHLNPFQPFFHILGKDTPRDKITNELNGTSGKRTNHNIANQNFADLYSLQSQFSVYRQNLAKGIIDLAKEGTILIALHDVHLAPLSSWQFLHYLSKFTLEFPVFLIASLRQDGKIIPDKELPVYVDILQRMNRERLLYRIQLNRFSVENMRQFLNVAFPRSDFSSTFLPALYEITGGIPELLVRVLEQLFENDKLYERNGIWFNLEPIPQQELLLKLSGSETVGFVKDFLAGNDETLIELIRFAAALQPPFTLPVLKIVSGVSGLSLTKRLAILKEKKVLKDSDDGGLFFKRPEIRTLVLAGMEEPELKRIHRKIADAVAAAQDLPEGERVELLAHHYYHSDAPAKALPYLRELFQHCIAHFAFTEAKEVFRKIETVQQNLPAGDDQASLYLRMVWLDRVLGNYEDSLKYAEEALHRCSPTMDFELYHNIRMQQGLTYFRLNDWQNARECFLEGLERSDRLPPFLQAMAHFGLGNVNLETAEYDRAKRHYQEAIRLAETVNARPLIATLYNNLGIIENILGNRIASITYYSKSIPIYKSLNDHFGLARVYTNIGMTYADEGSWEKANEFYGKSLRSSDEMGLIPLKSITFLNRSLALIKLGRFDEAREYNYKAYRLLERLKDELGIAEYHKIQGILERELGNWRDAFQQFEQALQTLKRNKNPLGEAETILEMAYLSRSMGNQEKAILYFEKALSAYQKLNIQDKQESIQAELQKIQETIEKDSGVV